MFCLGIWKNFDELEEVLTLEELFSIAESIADEKYNDRKFAAALKGIDLDGGSGSSEMVDITELDLNEDDSDITSLQGQKAAKTGFGIGAGLGFISD